MVVGSTLMPVFLKVLPFLLMAAGIGFVIKRAHEAGLIDALLAQRTASKAIVPSRDYFSVSQKAINHYWSLAFYENLEAFTLSSDTYTDESHGLIYYFIIDGRIRYIGQTKGNSLRWRMTKKQDSGCIGYSYRIKRNLLNAVVEGRLKISTKKIPKEQLDNYEISAIRRYGPTNKLWNQKHNPDFKKDNFYS